MKPLTRHISAHMALAPISVQQVTSLSACSHCAVGELCFPSAAPSNGHTHWPLANEQRFQLKRGEALFRAGDQQVAIYAVKSGFLKTSLPLADKQVTVVGFHSMGDVLGLSALGCGTHTTDAIALNGCEVCVIPLEKLEEAFEGAMESAHVQQLLAREIARLEAHAGVIGTFSAKQRVATFILEMSERWDERGYARTEFLLFMGHRDIGSFLGLTFETVSRTFSYFQSKQWINIEGKRLIIRDISALQAQVRSAH